MLILDINQNFVGPSGQFGERSFYIGLESTAPVVCVCPNNSTSYNIVLVIRQQYRQMLKHISNYRLTETTHIRYLFPQTVGKRGQPEQQPEITLKVIFHSIWAVIVDNKI